MSQIRFELNINEYTPQELEELLHLKYPYAHEDIEDKLDQLKTKIKADTNLNKNKLEEIFNFLGFVGNAINKHLLEIKNKVDKNVIHQYGSNIIIDRDTLRKKDPNGIPPSIKINPFRSGLGDTISMLNGWNNNTVTKIISLDSRFRDQYFKSTSTDFLIDLPITLNKVVSMTLVALEIPATYFQISKRLGNNFFHIFDDIFPQGAVNLWKITIPDGHYSREEMQTILNLMFQASSIPGTVPKVKPIASIDNVSGRTIIDLGDGQQAGGSLRSIFFNIRSDVAETGPILLSAHPLAMSELYSDQPIQSKLGWILGYRMATYYHGEGTILTPAPATYISEGIYDGWGSRYFYFVVDDFNKNSINGIDAVLNSSVIGDSILARITQSSIPSALNVGFTLEAALLKDNKATRRRIYTGPVTIKKLRIRILDAYGRIIDLNNMDISFSLKFLQLYD